MHKLKSKYAKNYTGTKSPTFSLECWLHALWLMRTRVEGIEHEHNVQSNSGKFNVNNTTYSLLNQLMVFKSLTNNKEIKLLYERNN